MEPIKWSEIEAECGNYRDGFVAVFRKYEGQPTDERTAQGHVVKVTPTSFARHVGVEQSTFARWVKRADLGSAPSSPPRAKRDLTRDVLRAARHEPEAVIDGIMDAPEATQDAIYHELKLRRAGEDRTPANRKAAAAAVHETFQPVRRVMATLGLELAVGSLEQAAEAVREAARSGALSEAGLAKVDAAHDDYVLARMEASMGADVR